MGGGLEGEQADPPQPQGGLGSCSHRSQSSSPAGPVESPLRGPSVTPLLTTPLPVPPS